MTWRDTSSSDYACWIIYEQVKPGRKEMVSSARPSPPRMLPDPDGKVPRDSLQMAKQATVDRDEEITHPMSPRTSSTTDLVGLDGAGEK